MLVECIDNSIYKLNLESIEATFPIKSTRGTQKYYAEIVSAIINSISSIVSRKKGSEQQKFQHRGIKGIIFKTVHNPAWDEVAKQLLANNELEQEETSSDFLQNTNVSYVFLCQEQLNVYACTGGYGSNYISKFMVLLVLPKNRR